ncbi:MAG: RNA methyltransferase [Oscillospiraceae bacterium]|nr:RNA methyltransferase [Oscillospiraceae bacterium]
MEHITSRKNPQIQMIRALGRSRRDREAAGLFVLDGEKLLREALQASAPVETVLWAEQTAFRLPDTVRQLTAPRDLVEHVSPLEHAPGPVFTVRLPEQRVPERVERLLVLENVQDPGNVGTVVRTANALGFPAVALVGACADLYSPKTARATMGAIFRQTVFACSMEELDALLKRSELPLYGAALTDTAEDVRGVDLRCAAVAVGSEGRGLSAAFLSRCDGEIIIPMRPDSESLNAAVAASILMWETARDL